MAISLLCLKLVLISTAVLSVALAVKSSVPLVVDFSTTQVPAIWSGFCSWLKPPYLYVVINGIIIFIAAASSTLYNMKGEEEDRGREVNVFDLDELQILRHRQTYGYDEVIETTTESADDDRPEEIRFDSSHHTVSEKSVFVVKEDDNNGSVVVQDENQSTWMPTTTTEVQSPPPVEKPLVTSRLCQRKPAKVTPEDGGRPLGVSKSKRQETLENTWKTITEGRSMPLHRHLKKPDTFSENFNGRQREINKDIAAVKKSETFKDRTNYQSPSPVKQKTPLKLRKESSLTHDELNRRVEAFIKKFNDEMRMQRQESLNQYKQIIYR